MKNNQGQLFTDKLSNEIKNLFHQVDHDHNGQSRLYFDNAGGSFRLKSVLNKLVEIDSIPDNIERTHTVARFLQDVQAAGERDFRCMLNAVGGSIYTTQTASSVMFDLVRAVAENVEGSNMVTTVLEHPSSFDAMSYYAERMGKSLRVAESNKDTGGVDTDDIIKLIDQDTCLLNVIYASNISGAKIDLEDVVRRARRIRPDLYIIVDAVQHAPHGLIDLELTPVDCISIAPYKFFGVHGSGMAWLSERTAVLPHHKLKGKEQNAWGLGSGVAWQYAAITEIFEYVCWLGSKFIDSQVKRELFAKGMQQIELHERALLNRLLEGDDDVVGLRHLPNIKVHLDHPDLSHRDLIVMIEIENQNVSDTVLKYEQKGVLVYQRTESSIYSQRMLSSFGLKGGVRISPLHVHTIADIDLFLKITAEISQ